MVNYYADSLLEAPELTVYLNCDTVLAINLQKFNLKATDELVFVIKNYDYIDSHYVYLFRTKYLDMDENGEVFFKITSEESKRLKPGAFYNILILSDAFNSRTETTCIKTTTNGRLRLGYGAQDLVVKSEFFEQGYEIISSRLELVDSAGADATTLSSEVLGIRLERASTGGVL